MTPKDLRDKKIKLVSELPNMEELLKHPMVQHANNGGFIVMMTINTLLEVLAQEIEEEE